MELRALALTFICKIFEFVASTDPGQFLIKKIDSLLWTLEIPAKYCVNGSESQYSNRELSWPVFWSVLIMLQIFREITSKILIKFKKGPIEADDLAKCLRKWRKGLRSIRFKVLQPISVSENETSNGNDATSSCTQKESKYGTVDYDLLEELMNRTFSDNDELDSTFTISRTADASMNCSSDEQSFLDDYQSPSKNDIQTLLNETLTIESDSESEHQETNVSVSSQLKEKSFKSTVDDTDESSFMGSRECSTSSPNKKSQSNDNISIGSFQNESASSEGRIGKVSLNQSGDPADALISQFVQQRIDGTTNFYLNGEFEHCSIKKSKSCNNTKLTGVSKRSYIPTFSSGIVKLPSNCRKSLESIDEEN